MINNDDIKSVSWLRSIWEIVYLNPSQDAIEYFKRYLKTIDAREYHYYRKIYTHGKYIEDAVDPEFVPEKKSFLINLIFL